MGRLLGGPSAGVTGWRAEQVHHSLHAAVHDIENCFRIVVKTWDWRCDNRSHLGEGCHGPKMAKVERRLANHEDQLSALFEGYIGGASQQIRGDAGCDRRHGVYRAGGNYHAVHGKTSACQSRADIFERIVKVSKRVPVRSSKSHFQEAG